jgi:predicted transcriptional regulator
MKNEINVEMIKNYMKENGLSKAKFCRQCKISMEVFNKILVNKDNFRIIALFKIAIVMKIEIFQMFE